MAQRESLFEILETFNSAKVKDQKPKKEDAGENKKQTRRFDPLRDLCSRLRAKEWGRERRGKGERGRERREENQAWVKVLQNHS